MRLDEHRQDAEDVKYWRSKSPGERIDAVIRLRRMVYGTGTRFQRNVVVSQRQAR